MTFTDDDLKRLKDNAWPKNLSYEELSVQHMIQPYLLARLEAAERVINPGCGSPGCQDAAYEAWRKAAGK